MKKGISLIVLVITIIVMIIIAGAIIISLNSTNLIDKSNEAVRKSNLAELQSAVALEYTNLYTAYLEEVAAGTAGPEDAPKADDVDDDTTIANLLVKLNNNPEGIKYRIVDGDKGVEVEEVPAST